MTFLKLFPIIAVSIILIIGVGLHVRAAELLCYNRSLDNPQAASLESPLSLLETSCIRKERDTIIFVYGLNGTASYVVSTSVLSAYLTISEINVVLLDWPSEARINNLGVAISYLRAVLNTVQVGNQLANALIILNKAGLDLGKVHLVGFSLGAQICGIAGLDPAGPLYEGLISVPNSLRETSASFVDIIHNDPEFYGVSEAVGTVDFWPNFYGYPHLQPGCPKGFYPIYDDSSRCSHDRSWMFFAESIINDKAFPATGYSDYQTWLRANGSNTDIAYMGQYVSLETTGNYYLSTKEDAPYSKGCDGLKPSP